MSACEMTHRLGSCRLAPITSNAASALRGLLLFACGMAMCGLLGTPAAYAAPAVQADAPGICAVPTAQGDGSGACVSPAQAAATGTDAAQARGSKLTVSRMAGTSAAANTDGSKVAAKLKAPKVKVKKRLSYGFKIAWKPISGAKRYCVQVRNAKLTGTAWKTVAKTKEPSASITKVGILMIPAKTKLEIRVRALAGKAKGPWSAVKKATTKGITPAKHIYSHRGTGTQALPHTYEAYDKALEQGSKALEQDVVLSKDGTLIVMHDKYLVTKSGKTYYYKDLTYRQIKKFKRANGERIHTMQDVFNRYKNTVTYVVELKRGKAVKALAEFVAKNKPKKFIVQSSSLATLKKAGEAIPRAKTLFLAYDAAALKKATRADYVDIVCMKQQLMNRANVRHIINAGKVPSAFLLNAETSIRKAIRLGVQTYFTDNTALAVKTEKLYRRYESF